MVTVINSPNDLLASIAKKVRARRLSLELTQEGLAKRANVSLGSLKKFEYTGQISLSSLLKLALVLDALDDFKTLFEKSPETYNTLDQLIKEKQTRKRGRIK